MLNFPIMEALWKANVTLVDAEPIMLEARMVKTDDEIVLLKHADAINDASLYYAIYKLDKPGLRKWDVHAEYIYIMRKHGCYVPNDGIRGLCASGERVNPYCRVS